MTTPPSTHGASPAVRRVSTGPPGGYPTEYSGYTAGYAGIRSPSRPTRWRSSSLVCAFLFAPLGILFGHISLSQIKKTGEEGRGLAIAGLVISYMLTVAGRPGRRAQRAVLRRSWRAASTNWIRIRRIPTTRRRLRRRSDSTLPPFKPPRDARVQLPVSGHHRAGEQARKPPRNGRVPTDPAIVGASIATSAGDIGLELDNAKTPCTVNNFASLAQQGYFDNTTCHRLTTEPNLAVLQCGDPSGTGTGGPGYRFPNEYPTNQYRLTDPALKTPVLYPRGTLAMANAGSGTNGSQFFLVYEDSMLPPTYTVFGTIDATGLATLDKIAAGGVADGSNDGKPAKAVTIESVRLD